MRFEDCHVNTPVAMVRGAGHHGCTLFTIRAVHEHPEREVCIDNGDPANPDLNTNGFTMTAWVRPGLLAAPLGDGSVHLSVAAKLAARVRELEARLAGVDAAGPSTTAPTESYAVGAFPGLPYGWGVASTWTTRELPVAIRLKGPNGQVVELARGEAADALAATFRDHQAMLTKMAAESPMGGLLSSAVSGIVAGLMGQAREGKKGRKRATDAVTLHSVAKLVQHELQRATTPPAPPTDPEELTTAHPGGLWDAEPRR